MIAARPAERIVTLDVLRGVAVMGILAINILGFGLPAAAATNPYAAGVPSAADLASWFASFVLVEGKMRGLFSLLFGASMLLVIERAEAAGRPGARTHFARMGWLLVFGLVHHYLIWSGDILILYAAVGLFAFAFRHGDVRALVATALLLLAAQLAYFAIITASFADIAAQAAAPGASADRLILWERVQHGLAPYDPVELREIVARYRGSYPQLVAYVLSEKLWDPIDELQTYGLETLAYFLLGMAGLRSGFLTGGWEDRSYRRVAAAGFAIGLPLELLLASALMATGFSTVAILAFDFTASVAVRPLLVVATAALVILLSRRRGALVARIGAAGRAAFTNYLGTSIVMTGIFFGWGLGLFGAFSRIELWPLVLAAWALMLAWSRPWLDRFRYGPFEWLWRSLARGRLEPLRRTYGEGVPG